MYNRIRDLREDQDLNQTQVAKMLGMSQTGYHGRPPASGYRSGGSSCPAGQSRRPRCRR